MIPPAQGSSIRSNLPGVLYGPHQGPRFLCWGLQDGYRDVRWERAAKEEAFSLDGCVFFC